MPVTTPVATPQSTDGTIPHLARVHVDVLHLAANGNTDQRIADALEISIHTVRDYWRTIKERLHAADRCHAVALAVASGVVTVNAAPILTRSTGPGTRSLLDLVAAAPRGLSVEEAEQLRAGVERLYRSRRASRAEHEALERSRKDIAEAVRRLTELAEHMPVGLAPFRRVIVSVADRLQMGRTRRDSHAA